MFRIEYLKLTEHPQLGEIELFLSDIEELNNNLKPYTSVIIGPNGTGKSFILRTISDILMQFNIFKTSEIRKINLPYSFQLRYFLEGKNYEIVSSFVITNGRSKIKNYEYYMNRPFTLENSFFLNKKFDQFRIPIQELEFPNYVIVNSILQTDRFLFKNSTPEDFYQYLGARSTSSTSSTKSSSRKTIKYLFNASSSNIDFKNNLKELLEFLGFEKSLKINYTTKINKLFFSGELTETNFKRYFEEWWHDDFVFSKRKQNNPLWSIPHYNNNFRDDQKKIANITEYLNLFAKNKLTHKARSTSKILSIDLFDNNFNEQEFEVIRQLEQLDIINIDGIIINKNNSALTLNEISSGEFHLIISMIGIFSKIEDNCLILIDEPEISLHPNWQMQYISFLKKVFSKYQSCHFILTSHSHFIVSDLEGKSSSVTALNRNIKTNKLESYLLKADTYGWSAEEILLKVFKTNTSRNYYIAEKLGEFLDFISNKDSTLEDIKLKFYELEIDKLNNLSNEDPLKTVYDTIMKEYVFN